MIGSSDAEVLRGYLAFMGSHLVEKNRNLSEEKAPGVNRIAKLNGTETYNIIIVGIPVVLDYGLDFTEGCCESSPDDGTTY